MANEGAGEHGSSDTHNKGNHDCVYTGSLVLIAISLLGMACIAWSRYGH
jgi:hypothetical protein